MVEQIKALCAANNTNIKSLEKELGFGNGTIRRWDERKPSYDRIESVARRFGVPVSDLIGDDQKEPAISDGREMSAKEIALAKVEEIAAAGDEKALWEIFERLSQKMQKK